MFHGYSKHGPLYLRVTVDTLALAFTYYFLIDVVSEMATGGDPPLDEWLISIGNLTEHGRSKLEKGTIVNLAAVHLISEADIDEIRLGVGDRAIFKAGWRALIGITVTPTDTSDPGDAPITAAQGTSHYSLTDLAALLKILPTSTPSIASVRAPHQPQASNSHASDAASRVTAQSLGQNQALRDLAASLGHPPVTESLPLDHYAQDADKGERCLLPINFATVLGAISGEDEEIVSSN